MNVESSSTAGELATPVHGRRPLAELAGHIVSRYHAPARSELVRLRALAAEAQAQEGQARPDLRTVAALVITLEDEMLRHMIVEERVLFPYVIELEMRARTGNRRPHVELEPTASPMRRMMKEHCDAEATLEALRGACDDYVPPANAKPATVLLYERLADFERALRHHVHLESDVLFRRAGELERS